MFLLGTRKHRCFVMNRCPIRDSEKEEPSTAATGKDAESAIQESSSGAYGAGIASGLDGSHFRPDEACSRAQTVTFLHRFAGSPEAGAANGFTDVDADAYYAAAVDWAVENGITNGTSTTAFSPDEDCTRGQTMTFLYRSER